MREIKFRAWDKEKHFMLYDDIYPDAKQNWDLYEQSLDCMLSVIQKDFILMQFTGLLDRNGKEIWEGDILKAEFDMGEKVIKGEVVWCDGFVGFAIECGNYNYRLSATATATRKVIGNIYENPELIEVSP